MSTAVATVSSTNAIEQIRALQALQRQNSRGITAYQAGDTPYTFSFNGNPYTVPPDGPWMGPNDFEARAYDGTLVINDHYGVAKGEVALARKARRDLKSLPATTLHASAIDIAAHAVKTSNGRVVLLVGTPEEQKELRRQARETFLAAKREACKATVAAFKQRNAQLSRAGHDPEWMDEHVAAAQQWLDEDKAGKHATKALLCPADGCGFQHNDKGVMELHLKASHQTAQRRKETEEALEGDETSGKKSKK